MVHNSPHPGTVLREWLADVTVTEAARRLGVTRVALSRVLNGSAGVSADASKSSAGEMYSPVLTSGCALLARVPTWTQSSVTTGRTAGQGLTFPRLIEVFHAAPAAKSIG
jgi:transcriptional regulator with XRE-family HTH domain